MNFMLTHRYLFVKSIALVSGATTNNLLNTFLINFYKGQNEKLKDQVHPTNMQLFPSLIHTTNKLYYRKIFLHIAIKCCNLYVWGSTIKDIRCS